jgi:3-phenylpropionate/cinnamic acid dioxygenase small subunit
MSISLEDRLAIHEFLARAAYAYDVRDVTLLESGFAPDASLTMRVAGGDLIGPFEGREAIMGLMTGSMAEQTDVRKHVISNVFIDEEDGEVSATSFLTLIATEGGETRLLSVAIYRDTLVRGDAGNWLLARRHIELDNAY